MKLQTIEVGPAGRQVYYYRAGSGDPLLYLHGLVGLSGAEPILERLATSFDVIAPYTPGWGPAKEQLPEIDEGPLDLVLHQCDILDALAIETTHVVGISIGAWIAAEFAAILPARVNKQVLVNPLGLWLDEAKGEDPFAQHPGWPSRVLFADPEGRKKHLIDGHEPMDAHVEELLNLRAAAKFLWPIPDTGVARRLPRITAPTLIASGDKDVVVPAAYGQAWHSAIRGSRLIIIPGAGHLADLDEPEMVARLVNEFFKGAIAAVA